MILEKKHHNLVIDSQMTFGIPASSIDHTQIAGLDVPDKIEDDIPTLNRMGYMRVDLDEYSKGFIEYATREGRRVLEIGCAYGFIVQHVLAKGGRIIANDLSKDHLSILLKNTSLDYLNSLYLYPGSFPEDINLPKESLNAVLSSRIMHFLQGQEIEKGLKKIHYWLVQNGKLFFIATSPYNIAFRDKFLLTYIDRVKRGNKWPGIINNSGVITPQHKDYIGPFINLFDVPQLEELLPKHGFKIDKISLFDFPKTIDSDNKGHVGLVATKV